ncbi:MAG: class I SAM-dependent methyltransferase [Rikenellaceae bacterium]|jgi:ubiquinone/menaquinone biosynthesis C-methylase UbiE|nr:class I SAM-dependent methyltransferase [Rikenellaceae bacterium]
MRSADGYRKLAGGYDAFLGEGNLWTRLACKLVWGFPDSAYAGRLLACLPEGFAGRLLDVPAGTGLFTCEKYSRMKQAEIVCVDYSQRMLDIACRRFEAAGLQHVVCRQGDAGALDFPDGTFDGALSMNGLHAFPDKEAALDEIARVLKRRGIFVGCCYVEGEKWRTDRFIRNVYVPCGWFTPPFMTRGALRAKLSERYEVVEWWGVGAIACFSCIKVR